VVLRDGGRHGAAYRQELFHAVVGAGLTLPEGALAVRRVWATSGRIDGVNEQLERYGISVAVEPGAVRPYSAEIRAAATAFVEALVARAPVHPDCVVGMGEVPFTNAYAAAGDEKALAAAVRSRVPLPPATGRVVLGAGPDEIAVDVERRSTSEGIDVGMMMRKRFDGENRGMLFEYPAAAYRHFWMKNCPIPIDVAYINGGRIEEIHEMEPGFGIEPRLLPYYDSGATAKYALEMPGGWFAARGVEAGDPVRIE